MSNPSEYLQRYLHELRDVLRPLDDPLQIQSAATRTLGEHLQVDRAFYVEMDEEADTAIVEREYLRGESPSLVGRHRLSDFGWVIPLMRRGDVVVIHDVVTSPLIPAANRPMMAAVQVRATVATPLVKGGALVGALCVTEPTPRELTSAEVELVFETGERIWSAIERARAEKTLHETEDRFRRLSEEALGRLAAGIAHDVNNALTLLTLRTDRLRDRHTDPESRKDLDAIRRTIEGTQSLISEVLTLGRRQRLTPEPVVIDAELPRLVPQLDGLVGPDITMRLDLGSAATPAYIDPSRLEQIITNLVLNAQDALPEGGTITISTGVRETTTTDIGSAGGHLLRPGTYVVVTVSDTGVGILPEALPHVFDPYFTTKPPSEGTGLGLATAYSTIVQSGGAITVESQPGEGAAFTLWLPTAPEGATESVRPAGRSRLVSEMIAVVEDDTELAEAIIDELALAGFRVEHAGTGSQALAMLTSPVDLLITDVYLPDLTGTQVAAELQARHPETPVLFISGAEPTDVATILPEHAHFLAKPFTRSMLLEAVRSLL